MNVKTYDIAIIGAGPAGLSAAIYAQRAGYQTICLEQNVHGGQIINTPEVENYPAVGRISGVEYATNLYEQAIGFGATVEYLPVISAALATGTGCKKLHTPKMEIEAGAVIIANGVERRKLNCLGEEKFLGRGVSYCAVCDGMFFKDKEVMVIGGGNTALEDAVYLAAICKRVYLVHRRDEFRGSPHEIQKVLNNEKITVIYDTVVTEINGTASVESVSLKNIKTEEEIKQDITAVFISVGMIPQNEMFMGIITLSKDGYIETPENCHTNIPGVFAAGDTRSKALRQLVTAAADGAIAATEAANYLAAVTNEQ